MTQSDLEAFLADLSNVQRSENFGYTFFFVGDDHRLPFTTIASSDNEYDKVSHLDRQGVFRVNIGVSKATFDALLGSSASQDIDYAALNVFLPHPDYARQHFVCILNPSGENAETTKRLVLEAHSISDARRQRKAGRRDIESADEA